MNKDTIITLEDNTKYVILEERKKDNKNYYFSLKLDKEENPTTEYEIFEINFTETDTYVNSLEEGEYKELIFLEFINKYIKSLQDKGTN